MLNINTILFPLKIIKLDAIDSTNTYLKNLSRKIEVEDELIVHALDQNHGRGQLGNSWVSRRGESLTFSMFKRFNELPISAVSHVLFAASLGVKRGLEKLAVPELSVKWPNDILSYNKKISGILIENQVVLGCLKSSVIGIGLNVNETTFDQLPNATSVLQATKCRNNLDEVLQIIAECVYAELNSVETGHLTKLKVDYEKALFRKDIASFFEDNFEKRFNGIIRGVTNTGELIVEKENDILQQYKLKELKLLL